ncbi:MAG: Bug family tripartite tricarboxylate transporter substrate binding protein [Burkholderiales bacterium]
MVKLGFAVAAACACWAMTAGAASNDYPTKPVRFISPFSAGGGTDTVARALALRLGDALGKTFIVDNRAGAEGIIGTELGSKSPADGYTLLVGNLGTLAINPNLRKVPYDPLRDFAPIIQTTASSTVLVVHLSLPVKNVRELVALAKTKPLNYGASSSGTFLPMELFKQMAKIDMTHVPYKGTGPTLTGILSGEVQVMFGGAINTVPLVKGGKLRALAVAGDRRAKALPDVPTVAEAGFPGYEANTWNGMLAPAGTPRAIVMRLNQEMMKILGTREVIEYMTADGAEPAGNTPDHFAAYIRSEHAKWAKVIKDAKISQSN